MTFKRFSRAFEVSGEVENISLPQATKRKVGDAFNQVIDELGGKSFNQGLYHVYRGDQVKKYSDIVSKMFPLTKGNVFVFARDWSGRQFAIDFDELSNGKPTVGCFDLGAPDNFCTDAPIDEFHESILPKMKDEALAEKFFLRWHKKTKKEVPFDECVGYAVPLFLGGKDDVANLQLTDMDVYLEITSQLWNAVKDLPEGTPIDQVMIERIMKQ